jgi:hypothetical protein
MTFRRLSGAAIGADLCFGAEIVGFRRISHRRSDPHLLHRLAAPGGRWAVGGGRWAMLARRRANGNKTREAFRALKGRLNDVVYRALHQDQTTTLTRAS